MRPTELNAILTAIVNYLYSSLDEKDFTHLAIFLSILSKEMFEMEALRALCRIEKEVEEEEAEEEEDDSSS